MLYAMSIAGKVRIQTPLKEVSRASAPSTETTIRYEVGRRLEPASRFHQPNSELLVLLNSAIALGMGDYDLQAHSLELEDSAVIHSEVCLRAPDIQLQQKLVRTLKGQALRP